MDISFRNDALKKLVESQARLRRKYGDQQAKTIMVRIGALKNYPNLYAVPSALPERRHALEGKRKGQFGINLKGGLRLVIVPDHDPIPLSADGGIDLLQVKAIRIIEINDYHKG